MKRLPFCMLLVAVVVLGGTACLEHTAAAGKPPARCPQMRAGVSCPQNYDPVVCDKCEYGNLCEAQAAGFKAGQCVKKGTKPAAPPAAQTCPPSKADVVCTKEYKPVVCNGCEYANPCLAGAADFKAEQCLPKAEAAKKACPEPKPGVVCTMEYAPVKCDGCLYPNACTAGAAGFTKEQCVPALGED